MDIFWLRARLDDDDIRRLVHAFYDEIREDARLGPIFNRRMGDQWPAHLDKMCRFWSTILLGTATYRGDPMAAHRTIPEIRGEDFDLWLGRFETVARRELGDEVGAAVYARARRMGDALRADLTA